LGEFLFSSCIGLPSSSFFPYSLQKLVKVAAEVTIKPQEGCVCPDHSYSCRADSLTEIEWDTKISMTSEISYNINREKKYADVESGGLRVLFSEVPVEGGLANLTAQLFLVDQHTWNQSNATCQAIGQGIARQDTVTVCVTGPASPPTSLSVVWDSPSAVVSFQSPLYGGECVDYYVVTAASEERNVLCNVTSDGTERNCSIYLGGGNVNHFNFTVHGVTRVNDSFVYNGHIATDYRLPFPENVRSVEEECGHVNVTWKSNHVIEPVNTTISWRGVHSSGARHYERGSSEDSHLLTLDYSETGPVEIAVTFSSAVCNKTTTITLNRKRCLTASETSPTPTPCDVGVTEAVKPTADSDVMCIAIGVGVCAALLVVVTVAVAVWCLVKKKRSKSESVPSSSCGDELKIPGSQTCKGCGDQQETPAPAAPETETDNTHPDVLPLLYDDLNTLTKEKKEQSSSMPMYHVLEGPTPVESAPETQEQESSVTDIPLYSVVDKSKKKKKTTN
ncbi:hypothetical protein GBAR_LOCUS24887, partial [Geodia barretti]